MRRLFNITIIYGLVVIALCSTQVKASRHFFPLTDEDLQQYIEEDRTSVQLCRNKTKGFLLRNSNSTTGTTTTITYTKNDFFECFRPEEEVFDFFDLLVKQNEKYIQKIDQISSTIEKRIVPGYKISLPSTSITGTQEEKKKKAIYIQGLIHAREWLAGSSVFYSMASLIDDLNTKNEKAMKIMEQYDFYFVPILNIDGYVYSWEKDRYWRKNRRFIADQGAYGVDLNRNFGPKEFFNLDQNMDASNQTFPGEKPLSEPETEGVMTFLRGLKGLSGAVDVHAYGGMVLHSYGNQWTDPIEPFGSSLKTLGQNVAQAIYAANASTPYINGASTDLYIAYGCFEDGVFLEFDMKVPAITIEVEGDDFIAPQEKIRPVGRSIYNGLLQYAIEVTRYQSAVESAKPKEKESSAISISNQLVGMSLMSLVVGVFLWTSSI